MKTKKTPPSPPAPTPAPIWSHGEGPAPDPTDAALCAAYCAGRDVAARPMADEALIPADIWTNRAHCAMLRKKGIIPADALRAIEKGLAQIEADHAGGLFRLDPALEDVHINIERAVALIAGEQPAGAMHTARSRNDQTATDIRLWMREELLANAERAAEAVDALAAFAARHPRTVMGGWTHGQPAMPTTLGHWAAAHASGLARDLQALVALWPMINLSPLGAAAGFGSSWPIDRKMTAEWLGFDAPQASSLDCVSTRWEMEARLGFALSMMMGHLSSLAQDLIFLSSPPRRQIELGAAFTTGSSIMPQKRNPDFAEVTRARAAAAQALVMANCAAGRGALSGYNRDSQWTKYWVMDLVYEVGEAPRVFARAVATIRPDLPALEKMAGEDFISAVDLADRLASSRKIEFRRVYHLIGRAVSRDRHKGRFELETLNALMAEEGIHPPLTAAELRQATDPRQAVERRTSQGGPSPKETLALAAKLAAEAAEGARWVRQRRKDLDKAKSRLRESIATLGQSKA